MTTGVGRCPVCQATLTSGEVEVRAPGYRVVAGDVLGLIEKLGARVAAGEQLATVVGRFLSRADGVSKLLRALVEYDEARDAY